MPKRNGKNCIDELFSSDSNSEADVNNPSNLKEKLKSAKTCKNLKEHTKPKRLNNSCRKQREKDCVDEFREKMHRFPRYDGTHTHTHLSHL